MNFSKTIIRWYHKNKRDLPWRHTKDPYKIWLSEIILQQTRVQQGLPYYKTFAKKFLTIRHLAKAKEDVVMKAWQGLGYYSRARNLHHTAKFICKNLKGKFPTEYDEIIKLKGVGDYTAGAIASFAFNKPHPVVDGNVFRVLSRYFGIKTSIDSTRGKKEFFEKALLLLDRKNPSIFNQAIMEFGAMQCIPRHTDCRKCPLKKTCKAFKNDEVSILPVKSSPKASVRTRYFNYFIIRKNGKILIKKRTANDIWKNLYDFPMIETIREVKRFPIFHHSIIPRHRSRKGILEGWKDGRKIICKGSLKQILSHQIIFAKFWEVRGSAHKITSVNGHKEGLGYVNDNQLNKLAFPRLIERYFDKNISFQKF